jgi:hypothetical protein
MRVHQKKPLSSNDLFRVARGMCSVKRRPSDGHIAAFRRHVTFFYFSFLLLGLVVDFLCIVYFFLFVMLVTWPAHVRVLPTALLDNYKI